jgi:Putative type VII ESX secretion system translocon, EccE
VSESRQTYRFGPVERHGFLGPIRLSQAAVVLAGALVGLILLGSSPSPGRAAGALALLGISIAAATVPLGARTAEQWLPVVLRWMIRRGTGAHEFRSSAPSAGLRIGQRQSAVAADALPPALRGIRIIELPYRDRAVGGVSERGGRLLTAVLACRVVSFSLLDAETQARNMSHWGTTLAASADTPVRRIQWLERTVPAETDELARWLHAERDPELALRGAPLLESYLELIERTVAVSQEHEVLLAVQVDAARIRKGGRDAAAGALIEETERITDSLRRAGAHVHGALTAEHLAGLFRTAFDPYVHACSDPDHSGRSPWPVGAVESWDHYRTDGAVHATHWVAGWPRVDVGALFLDTVLSDSSAVRTMAVTFAPMSPDRSIREVEAQVTRDQADSALRARFGQTETARQQQAYGSTRRREAELAAGYGEVRFTGFITVSAPDVEQLRSAAAQVKRDAARSRLELQAMYGQQADAFTFALPLCRGLR